MNQRLHVTASTPDTIPTESRSATRTILASTANSRIPQVMRGNHHHRHTVQLEYEVKVPLAQAYEGGEDREKELKHT